MATWLVHYAKAGEVGTGNEYIVLLDCDRRPTKRDVEENRRPDFKHIGTHEVLASVPDSLPIGYTMMAED